MAKKASFAAASFSNLRAAAGEGAGEPLRIALLDIDEDPNQPRKAFDQAGIAHRHLPAYSPDMNPIEQAWSKLKTHLRAKAARTRDALERAIPDALATITSSNAQGWFRKAGYAPN